MIATNRGAKVSVVETAKQCEKGAVQAEPRPVMGLAIMALLAWSLSQHPLCAQQDRGRIAHWEFDHFMLRTGKADSSRELLEAKLVEEIRWFDQSFQLTEEQEQKLYLAGQGDIKRFLDRLSAARRAMASVESEPEEDGQEPASEVERLRRDYAAGLFSTSSLFQKVLERTLTPAQIARKERRRDPQFFSAVRSYMLSTTKTLDLSAAQSDALEGLLIESLPRTGMATDYRNYLIAYRVSKIPEEQFAEILEEPQLEALQSALSHARALEPFLRRQGWVDDEDHDKSKAIDER